MRSHASPFLLAALVALAVLPGCGKKSSTAPADPNAGLYGTWSGTTEGGSPQAVRIEVSASGVVFALGGVTYPAQVVQVQDPVLMFNATLPNDGMHVMGERAGETLTGSAVRTSGGSEAWSATRSTAR